MSRSSWRGRGVLQPRRCVHFGVGLCVVRQRCGAGLVPVGIVLLRKKRRVGEEAEGKRRGSSCVLINSVGTYNVTYREGVFVVLRTGPRHVQQWVSWVAMCGVGSWPISIAIPPINGVPVEAGRRCRRARRIWGRAESQGKVAWGLARGRKRPDQIDDEPIENRTDPRSSVPKIAFFFM